MSEKKMLVITGGSLRDKSVRDHGVRDTPTRREYFDPEHAMDGMTFEQKLEWAVHGIPFLTECERFDDFEDIIEEFLEQWPEEGDFEAWLDEGCPEDGPEMDSDDLAELYGLKTGLDIFYALDEEVAASLGLYLEINMIGDRIPSFYGDPVAFNKALEECGIDDVAIDLLDEQSNRELKEEQECHRRREAERLKREAEARERAKVPIGRANVAATVLGWRQPYVCPTSVMVHGGSNQHHVDEPVGEAQLVEAMYCWHHWLNKKDIGALAARGILNRLVERYHHEVDAESPDPAWSDEELGAWLSDKVMAFREPEWRMRKPTPIPVYDPEEDIMDGFKIRMTVGAYVQGMAHEGWREELLAIGNDEKFLRELKLNGADEKCIEAFFADLYRMPTEKVN